MKPFDRYVLKQLIVGLTLIVVVLTSVIWLVQSSRFVYMIVNSGLSASTFVYLTSLLIPNVLVLVLPLSFFGATLFVYNKLITDREIVVMRATGASPLALARPVLIAGAGVVFLGYYIYLVLVPDAHQKFRALKWDVRYNYSHILLQEGAFNTVSDGITIYVRERSKDGQLLGIMAHDSRNPEKPYTLMAERGALTQVDGSPRVIMFNGNRQSVDKKTKQLSILYFDRYAFDLNKARKETVERYRSARERSISELLNADNDKTVLGVDVGKFKIEAHKRLTTGLSGLTYAIIGLAFLLSGNTARRSFTSRIIYAVITIVALEASGLGLKNTISGNLQLLPLIYIHAILPLMLGLVFLVWTPRRQVPMMEQL